LISYGAYVNARDYGGNTALMEAASCEDDNKASEIVHALIEAGAHINTKLISGVTKGWSAVMFAEFAGNTKTVSVLRKAGALGKLTAKQRQDYIEFLRVKGNN
ncbi:MAG: ankyrin repeat domain-containing protein, partial [Synergistaceae bacterium]|nr:ankyrin repeat domain-containing protein [Synergistaceae bacterium]